MTRFRNFTTLTLIAALLLIPFIKPKAVFADSQTLHMACQDNVYHGTLGNWDWPSKLRSPGGTGTTAASNFDKENSSYIIFKTPVQQFLSVTFGADGNQTMPANPYFFTVGQSEADSFPNNSWNQYTTKIASNTSRLSLMQETPTDQYIINNPISIQTHTITDGTTTDRRTVGGGGSISTSRQGFNTTAVGCVEVAHNVDYMSSWTYTQFTQNINAGDEITCSTFDIACHIAATFRSIGDTFNAVGQAIVRGFAALFAPDMTEIQNSFSDFNTFMQQKLGFLVFPIVFLVDSINSFSDTTNQWCSSSSCVKNLGNMLGGNLTIDFNALKNTMPSIWTFFISTMRGLIVVALVLGIRRKYMEVTDR